MRSLFFFFFVALLTAPLVAQDKGPDSTAVLKEIRDLGLSKDDLDQFDNVITRHREKLEAARAEVDVLKAQLAKALVPAKPDRPNIRKLIRESLAVEGDLRFAQIERQIELREVLGEKRWKVFNKVLRSYREWIKADAAGRQAVTDAALVRTFGLFDELVP